MDLSNILKYRLARSMRRDTAVRRCGRAMISFSFDDFPKSAAETGASILESRGIAGTFYAVARYAGQTVDGVVQYDFHDLNRLKAAGHEIGCHTGTHKRLASAPIAEIGAEFRLNRLELSEAGFVDDLRTMAYPYGDVSVAAKQVAARHFSTCRGVWAGLNEEVFDRALLKCVCLERHVLAQRSAEAWIDLAVERGAWLIFLTHDVQRQPTSFGIEPDDLERIADYAVRSGAEILPVQEAFDRSVVTD